MIFKKVYNRELVYDGVEKNLYHLEKEILLINGEKIRISIAENENVKELNELKNRIDDFDFNLIIAECNLKASSLLGIFKNQNNLKSYYNIVEPKTKKYLIILSYGEFQPARYKLYIEGVWEIN